MEFTRSEIKTSKYLGAFLKEVREKKELTLEKAEEATKVRVKYLKALEDEDFTILPETVYAAGFLAKYADFLGLKKDDLVHQFKRERGLRSESSRLLPERKIKESIFFITPKSIIFFLVTIAIIGIVSYIFYNVRQFTLPPNLEIGSPFSGQVVKDNKIEIIGKTDEGTTLTINNQMVLIDNNGNFKQEVHLNVGQTVFEVKSINSLKKEKIKIIKVIAEY